MMSAEVAGESTSEKQDELIDAHGNLDDIFDDDVGALRDHLLDHRVLGVFDNTFDESPPVAKKLMKSPPLTGSNSAKDDNLGGAWQDDAADIPHRRELIRQM